MLHRFLPVLVTAMLAGGCASLVDGQNQSVSVLTPDCPGAACRLHNDKGRWHVATTPASVVVNRSFADLVVNCSKDTAPPVMKAFPSSTKGMAYGNILLGGVIGAGEGGCCADRYFDRALLDGCDPGSPCPSSA